MSRSRHHGCACAMCRFDNKAKLKRAQRKADARDDADAFEPDEPGDSRPTEEFPPDDSWPLDAWCPDEWRAA